jgi:hypothetical protein
MEAESLAVRTVAHYFLQNSVSATVAISNQTVGAWPRILHTWTLPFESSDVPTVRAVEQVNMMPSSSIAVNPDAVMAQ